VSEPVRALVVDDSRAMRTILSSMLAELGFVVVEAKDGREALDRLKAHPDVKLALVDWNMPEMDGLEFVKVVRALPAWDAVRIVIVSTETERAQMYKVLTAGADEYVMKPFTKDVVEGKLKLIGVLT
jgi:two-component system chemotaxis response regulator CheY